MSRYTFYYVSGLMLIFMGMVIFLDVVVFQTNYMNQLILPRMIGYVAAVIEIGYGMYYIHKAQMYKASGM